jgi:hypothetical protein
LPQIGDDDHGQVAGNCTGVVMACHDEAADWGAQRRVSLQFLRASNGGLRLREVGSSKFALRRRRAMGRFRGIQPLPRQCTRLEQCPGPFVFSRRVGKRRFRRLD